MSIDLISESDYENLPDDPEERFVALEAICRKNMSDIISEDTPADYDRMVRMQYMNTVSTAADELGLNFPYLADSFSIHDFEKFLLAANSLSTRVRLRNYGRNSPTSVRLANRTRGLIELELQKLRDMIIRSDLPEDRISALLRKLDELQSEIAKPRVRFGAIFAILAYVGAGVVGTTTVLADAPDAIANITKYIGKDKEAEQEEVSRLGPPPKPKQLAAPTPESKSTSYDDEIPF